MPLMKEQENINQSKLLIYEELFLRSMTKKKINILENLETLHISHLQNEHLYSKNFQIY